MADQNFKVKRGLEVGVGGTVLTATPTGGVGIGTTNPTELLDVQGNVRIRGDIYDFDNSPGTSGFLLTNLATGIKWDNPANITVGQATLAGTANTALSLNGVSEGELNVGAAQTATNLSGGDSGDIPYQMSPGITTYLDATTASNGQVILWDGSTPIWGDVSGAAGFFGGITVKDETNTVVGNAGSITTLDICLLYTSPSPRDRTRSRMPSSA